MIERENEAQFGKLGGKIEMTRFCCKFFNRYLLKLQMFFHFLNVAEFPWVVAIIQKVHDNEDVVNLYKCGGTLIHPSVIMTAAHCIFDLKNITELMVRAGMYSK